MTTTSSLQSRIAAFEQAAADAIDPEMMAAKISAKSDRKKYAFASALANDLRHTRAALRAVASDGEESCTFASLYKYADGSIANLNRVLQNMKEANEISFAPECFFAGVHDHEVIILHKQFWKEAYKVDEENVFRPGRLFKNVIEEERKGRSYVAEDRETRHVTECSVCSRQVCVEERITIRAQVFHLSCLSCAVCGACPRQKKDYITFDGQVCCSSDCIQRYDAAHIRQRRENLSCTAGSLLPVASHS